jgi:hypothetical protein
LSLKSKNPIGPNRCSSIFTQNHGETIHRSSSNSRKGVKSVKSLGTLRLFHFDVG